MEEIDNQLSVLMHFESLALWEEKNLFDERTDNAKGYMGCIRGAFEENIRRLENVAWLKKIDDTMSFHSEFEALFHFLESEKANFILRSISDADIFCKSSLHDHIPCPFNRERWGWRVLTDKYIWYVALTPWNPKCQFMLYCYYRNMLMNYLAKKKSLPEICYCLLKYTGEIILVQYGTYTYSVLSQYGRNALKNRIIANELNNALQISVAQSAAMENGLIFGWDTPVADPSNYDEEGYYCSIDTRSNQEKK